MYNFSRFEHALGGVVVQIENISSGTSMELEVKVAGRTVSFQSEISMILRSSIFIQSIKVNNQTIGFTEDCVINFVYKSSGKVYIWENVSVTLIRYNGEILHKIELIGEGKPYNRRNAYRTYIGEEVPAYINTQKGTVSLTVLLKDISETGLGFISKEELDLDRTVRIKIKDFNTFLSLSGFIVRKEFLPNINSYIYGCKFCEKNDKLGRYIAKKQGEQLRKNGVLTSTTLSLKGRRVVH